MPALTSPVFDAFVAPATARPGWWRLPLGLVLAVGVHFAATLGVILAGASLGLDVGGALRGRGGPAATALLLASFLGLSLGVCAALRLVHRRPCGSVLGPRGRLYRGVLIGAGVTLALVLPWVLLDALFEPPLPNLPPARWLLWLGPGLLLVLVQTSAEEIFFRGYLLQELGARFRSPLVWMVLPSAIFGLLHLDVDRFGPNAWLVVANAGLIGLIAADVTARTGSLGAAIGLHFANNAVGLLGVALAGDISGLALFVTPFQAGQTVTMRQGLLLEIGVMVVVYLIYLRIMRRRPA